jgi:hypothetical protein
MPPGPPPTTQQVVRSESRIGSEISDFERGITSGAKDPPNLSESRRQIYTAQQIGSRHAPPGGDDFHPSSPIITAICPATNMGKVVL